SLTKNEKKVLSILIDDAKISDSEIASRIKISPQGVRKIRKKLEEEYIKEYRTIVDYEKIGIRVFAIAQIKVLNRDVLDDRHIIGAFEVNEADVTHIMVLGFGSLEELDAYKMSIVKHAEIRKINVISKMGFLKNSPVELIKGNLK
ncbi:winged helix-turn-helix transcriptional regulator, partial [Candidatus Woesearchaeota archaeon]|nr:winged helix-turn-helix transcriptional regulator [Candidatus Woesearchaeota archaeon]